MMKKVLAVVLVVTVFGAAIGVMSTTSFAQSFLNRETEESAATESEPLAAVSAPDTVLAEAKIVPLREADLSLAVSGIVAEVFAAEGGEVRLQKREVQHHGGQER